MIEIDPSSLNARDMMLLLHGLIVPRPIAWVSTATSETQANLAPHSFFNAVSSYPPILMFSSSHAPTRPGGMKDTIVNIERTQEFVVNLVSENLLDAMNQSSAEVASEVDEFDLAGLSKARSHVVKAPRVAEARASLECRLHSMHTFGESRAVFGEVVFVHISEEVWREGRVAPDLLQPVARLGGALYAGLGNIVRIARP